MGLFDRFKRKVKEAAEEVDIDAILADEESEEGKEAVRSREIIEPKKQVEVAESSSPIIKKNDDWDDWDPALIFVMGSAVVVATIGFWLGGKRATPLFDTEFHAPASSTLDGPLLGGAVLFGVGWGVSGFCPGPALVGVMTLDQRALLFIVAYGVGVALFEILVSPRLQLATMQEPSIVDG